MAAPPGPREPGVGAELSLDFNLELENCDFPSIGGSEMSLTLKSNSSTVLSQMDLRDIDDDFNETNERGNCSGDSGETTEEDLQTLKEKVRNLAVRPVEGGDGQQEHDVWENELIATVNKLDYLMMMKEYSGDNNNKNKFFNENQSYHTTNSTPPSGGNLPMNRLIDGRQTTITDNMNLSSLPVTPEKLTAIKTLQKCEPLPSVNVSMRELPLLARLSTEVIDRQIGYTRRRRRSLE